MPTIHNPTHFEPADYDVVDYLDNKRPVYCGETAEGFAMLVAEWERDMAAALGEDWRRKCHRCVHCGNARVRWITVVTHTPTGERMVFGADCTARLHFPNRVAFKLAIMQSKAEARHARIKIWQARERFLAERPELAAVVARRATITNAFVLDVLSKLDRYGSISERQIAAIGEAEARDIERAAARAAEATEVVGDAPEGRAEVEGVVVMVKDYEDSFAPGGYVTKMMIKLANNAKAFCTVPSAATVSRGDRVKVRATWARKAGDAGFAFGKRPMILEQIEAGA